MSKFPYLPLAVDAYRNDTAHLTLEEHGAYLMLLMLAWRSPGCRLPDDDAKLARMLGLTAKKWARIKENVMGFWDLEGGFWIQPRLMKEHQFVSRKSEQNRSAGSRGGHSKSLKNKQLDLADATANATANAVADALPLNTLHSTPDTECSDRTVQSHSENNEGDKADNGHASSVPEKPSKYEFEASVIRLLPHHFRLWQDANPHLSLKSELLGLDQTAAKIKADGGNWFLAVPAILAKRNRDAALDRERIRAEAEARANAPRPKPSAMCC
ncbi:YdaU family protein [Methylobacterium oryzisoli]|uniref:YdaU family protein n=1 Tax=Methylobacterium oryzisoli TaxID=3385502 RepID=UPI003891C11D